MVFGPYLLRGLVDIVLATTRNLPAAMAALGLYGVGTSTGMVTYTSLLQADVPGHSRGRVFAGFDMIWQTGRLASLGLGGVTADALGIQAVYLLGGVCSCSQAPSAWPDSGPSKAPTPVCDPKGRNALIRDPPPRVPAPRSFKSRTLGVSERRATGEPSFAGRGLP